MTGPGYELGDLPDDLVTNIAMPLPIHPLVPRVVAQVDWMLPAAAGMSCELCRALRRVGGPMGEQDE